MKLLGSLFTRRTIVCGKNGSNQGFTLIELMVTIGIFVLMTAIMLARYNSYYSGTVFTNLAYDIALTIKQAQSYGISVKVKDPESNFWSAYGIRLNLDNNNNSFSLMSYRIDSFSGGDFSSVTAVEEKAYTLKYGAKIEKICIGISCSDASTGVNKLDIIFRRPKPETYICDISSCQWLSEVDGNNQGNVVVITLLAGDGVTKKYVKVNSVGQIYVE